MKTTWFVCVQAGVGHEYNNTISESEFFGPYTQSQAEKLAKQINELYERYLPHDKERPVADAMPLTHRAPRDVIDELKELYDVTGEETK